jgi:hypothetical protein
MLQTSKTSGPAGFGRVIGAPRAGAVDPLTVLGFMLDVVNTEAAAVCSARETGDPAALDEAYEDIVARWDAIMAKIALTPANDTAGIIVKLRAVAEAVVDGGQVERVVAEVAQSALDDVERIESGE